MHTSAALDHTDRMDSTQVRIRQPPNWARFVPNKLKRFLTSPKGRQALIYIQLYASGRDRSASKAYKDKYKLPKCWRRKARKLQQPGSCYPVMRDIMDVTVPSDPKVPGTRRACEDLPNFLIGCVCTGALMFAPAGCLNGIPMVVLHSNDLSHLKRYPNCDPYLERLERFFLVSAGE
jgi:hypothetical protein